MRDQSRDIATTWRRSARRVPQNPRHGGMVEWPLGIDCVVRGGAIEKFGSMNVLCSDKTGTIREGKVRVQAALDAQGGELAYDFLRK
jgi:hypothetical protein